MSEKKTALSESIEISVGSALLKGELTLPVDARGVVLFAHGSGSSRESPRNNLVASFFHEHRIGTLLFDLLTEEEGRLDQLTHELRFNIPFLAERLIAATEWIEKYPETHSLSVGYFGASTGAAAALLAAAELKSHIQAIVSRGGRPDLAGHVLGKVLAPTLLIVGGSDFGVIELNQNAFDLLACKKKLEMVPGATHLFDEPGTLEEVGRMAALWFENHL